MSKMRDFLEGLWYNNPTLVMIIGMCPVLAITNLAVNGLAMGIATLFVLVFSEFIISLLRKLIPDEIRIPCFTIIIATFVTIVDYILLAYFPAIHSVLGIFLPLIIVNCLILARIESYASKMPPLDSTIDALGMGIGFTGALILISSIREILGFGTIFGFKVMWSSFQPILLMTLPAGAFITLGLSIAIFNKIKNQKNQETTGCMHCNSKWVCKK